MKRLNLFILLKENKTHALSIGYRMNVSAFRDLWAQAMF